MIVSATCILRPSEQIEENLKQSVAHYNKSDAVYNMDEVQRSMEVGRVNQLQPCLLKN